MTFGLFILGLVLFLGIHSVSIAARDWRDRQRTALGEGMWAGLYSVVSLIGFVLIVWTYGDARAAAPLIYEPPVWMKHLTGLLMLLAAISFGAYLAPAGRIKAALKHPMLLSVKIWATAHLLANGDLASILLFGAFLAWAVADRISLKRRNAPLPVAGENAMRNDVIAVVAGLALYAAFVLGGHEWLFGVAPFAVG
jgi:uncharacterized membrane protein